MTTLEEQVAANYAKYRGRCKELSDKAVLDDPTLTLVRGYYFCPIWNKEEQHWWTKKPDGTIYDPSVKQFPSAGLGIYTEFDGLVECANCGRQVKEEEASTEGRYAFCSCRCYGQFVDIY